MTARVHSIAAPTGIVALLKSYDSSMGGHFLVGVVLNSWRQREAVGGSYTERSNDCQFQSAVSPIVTVAPLERWESS
jgi:hypothetical protein